MERRLFLTSVASCALTGCLGGRTDSGPPVYAADVPPAAASGFDHHDLPRIDTHDGVNLRDYAAPRLFVDLAGVSAEDTETVTSFGDRRRTSVALGEFDADARSESLAESGFVESGTRRGFALFEADRPTGVSRFAVADYALVLSSLPEAAVRDCVDVLGGGATSAYDSDDDFALLADGLDFPGAAFVSGIRTDRMTDDVARGESVVLADEDTAEVVLVRVYPDSETAEDALDSVNVTASGRVRGPRAELDGRTVRVTGEVSVGRL